MYADDTTFYCNIKDIPNYENVLKVELCKITNWLAANKLSLNVGKTKFMVFHSDKKKVVYPKLLINNIEIERVDYFKCFGATIESQLLDKHVNYVSLKILKTSGILYRLRSENSTYILKSIYNTLLLPHLTYCILSLGSQIGKIHLLQKRAIRNFTTSAYNAHTEPLHKEQNILKVHDLYRLSIL